MTKATPKKKKYRLYIVALTERYETPVWASSRQEAIDAVDAHGGSGPVSHHVSAQPTAGLRSSATYDTEDGP